MRSPSTAERPIALVAPSKHLKQLNLIRTLILCILWLTLVLAYHHIDSVFAYLLLTLLAFSSITILTVIRLKNSLSVTCIEFFIHLILDVLCLGILFYLSGGANNPFISYLLVSICISAATLPWRFTWSITALCLGTYTFLLFFYIKLPLFDMSHNHNTNLSWHILGMWFNFSLSAALITYFVVKMAKTLREQDEMLNSLREDELRNEQLMAVAMLAAGAAHEMNTPLSTMTVLLSDLQAEHKNNPHLLNDINILKQQVKLCADTLKNLVQESSEANEGKFKQQTIERFCNQIIDRWQLMRPDIRFSLSFTNTLNKKIAHDPHLDHAIINLLNNAADESPSKIQLNIYCEHNQLIWEIIDSGQGINSQLKGTLGKIVQSTKEKGLGIGMLLAHAAIKNAGGNVTHTPNETIGTLTKLKLPLAP